MFKVQTQHQSCIRAVQWAVAAVKLCFHRFFFQSRTVISSTAAFLHYEKWKKSLFKGEAMNASITLLFTAFM